MNKYRIDAIENNFFIEGLQGAGKSTFVQKLSAELTDYKVFCEGDYSPVELAWCAYVTEEQYHNVLMKYPTLRDEIKQKTVVEGEHRIICYTKILTDAPNFHRDLEAYEIYNGNYDIESFENVILSRFEKWNGERQIFECSIFQNIIENQMLFFMMSEDEIMHFYKRLKNVLMNKSFQIIYLDVDDIPETIDVIRIERSDNNGNELWFPMMLKYLEESPYGRKHALTGPDGLFKHLARRKALEHRIIHEIFKENACIIKSKNYNLSDVITLLKTSNAK